jgi:hypothetical protein
VAENDDDVEMGVVPMARTKEKSICVRLYEEPRSWWESHEVDYLCEPNGDVDLDALAKLLLVEGHLWVGSPA